MWGVHVCVHACLPVWGHTHVNRCTCTCLFVWGSQRLILVVFLDPHLLHWVRVSLLNSRVHWFGKSSWSAYSIYGSTYLWILCLPPKHWDYGHAATPFHFTQVLGIRDRVLIHVASALYTEPFLSVTPALISLWARVTSSSHQGQLIFKGSLACARNAGCSLNYLTCCLLKILCLHSTSSVPSASPTLLAIPPGNISVTNSHVHWFSSQAKLLRNQPKIENVHHNYLYHIWDRLSESCECAQHPSKSQWDWKTVICCYTLLPLLEKRSMFTYDTQSLRLRVTILNTDRHQC